MTGRRPLARVRAKKSSPSQAPLAHSASRTLPRRDDSGKQWTLPQVETAVLAIVLKLAPGWSPGQVTLSTRFEADLGWDEPYMLSLVKPVRARLHETLPAGTVVGLRRVGDLVKSVWSKMEEVP
jgi:hypothetical protein